MCKQIGDEHIHYNIVMINPDKHLTDLDMLKSIASRIGGATAGQVVLKIIELRQLSVDLSMYGIDFMQTEPISTYQICHKDEDQSPSVDWDKWLFIEHDTSGDDRPPANARVAHITH